MGGTRLLKGEVAELSAENVRNDSFFQRLVLSWVYGVIKRGRNGLLRLDQLRMPSAQAAEVASARFLEQWEQEVAANPQAPSLLYALWRSFGREFAAAGCFKLLWSTFVILGASFFVNYVGGCLKRPGYGVIKIAATATTLVRPFFSPG
jgi:ATP-binding cassette subfamily C (CFTR/MRP) protein 1